MASFAFLHAADLHIDSPLRGLETDPDAPVARIRGATRAAFTNLVDLAIAERVAFVLIAGDLIDGEWQDWRTGNFLTGEIRRLTEAGVRLVAIRGNHDAANPVLARLRLPNGARLLGAEKPETIRIPELDAAIHGQSFAAREVTENLARNYPAPLPGCFNIGLLHTAATGRPGHETYAPCDVDQLARHGYAYWALGHIHAREEVLRDPCWVVFSGNIQGRSVRETGPKGASLVTVREGKVAAVAHRALDTVRWAQLDIDIAGAAQEEAALAATRRALDDALRSAEGRLLAVRIVLRGACAAHAALTRDLGATRDRLRHEAYALAGTDTVWVEETRLGTRPAVDLDAIAARDDAVGALIRAIRAVQPQDLAEAARTYCGGLLDRAPGVREGLGTEHAAVAAARGEIPPALLQRARACCWGGCWRAKQCA